MFKAVFFPNPFLRYGLIRLGEVRRQGLADFGFASCQILRILRRLAWPQKILDPVCF
jgi:hypothetical protein